LILLLFPGVAIILYVPVAILGEKRIIGYAL